MRYSLQAGIAKERKFNKQRILAAGLATSFIALTGNAWAASRFDVANAGRAIIAQVENCDHSNDAVKLAYLQTRKGVSIVQMTTTLPYVAYPTENDITALASRVIPAPRTTNGRLLNDGHQWLVDAQQTLIDGVTTCLSDTPAHL